MVNTFSRVRKEKRHKASDLIYIMTLNDKQAMFFQFNFLIDNNHKQLIYMEGVEKNMIGTFVRVIYNIMIHVSCT